MTILRKIAVVGTGYVGQVVAVAFAGKGNQVVGVDKDESKVSSLNKGIPTIHEEDLEPLLRKAVLEDKTLTFTSSIAEALKDSEIIFIAVGTPPGENGEADLKYVREVASEIGQNMDHPIIVVDKSTVPIETAFMVRDIISDELKKRNLDIDFEVVSNPEFLAEGKAVNDMLNPSRVVVGADNPETLKIMEKLYKPFTRRTERFHGMSLVDAETTKYACNWMLAERISGINALASACECIGADIIKVRNAMAADPRIGDRFLHPSCGYGGSCFPKDVKALAFQAEQAGCPEEVLAMLRAPEVMNNFQKESVARKTQKRFGADLSGKKFAVWGLAFKKGTDDMRESAAINVIEKLSKAGAEIVAYDPLAMKQAKEVYLKDLSVRYVENMYDALPGCDALIIMTETDIYLSPDFERIKKSLKNPVIFDGRNLYDPEEMEDMGIEYFGIGRGLSIRK